jgi:hypothetical protein
MRKGIVAFTLITVVTAHVYLLAFAQSPTTGPSFEVVSIKRNMSVMGPGYRSNVVTWRPDGGLTMTNVTVSSIIARAHPGTVPADIVGLPAWDRHERYDVRATSPVVFSDVTDTPASPAATSGSDRDLNRWTSTARKSSRSPAPPPRRSRTRPLPRHRLKPRT